MLSNYYHYYSCLVYILVLLLSLLLQPQASIVTYIVTEFLLPLLFYLLYITAAAATITTYSILLLLLYLLLFTIPFVLLATIYHRQKRERHFCTFLSVMNFFLQFFILYSPLTFYSVMRCLLPLPTLPTLRLATF